MSRPMDQQSLPGFSNPEPPATPKPSKYWNGGNGNGDNGARHGVSAVKTVIIWFASRVGLGTTLLLLTLPHG